MKFIIIGFILLSIGTGYFFVCYENLPELEPNKIYWPDDTPEIAELNKSIALQMLGITLFIYGFLVCFRVDLADNPKVKLRNPEIDIHNPGKNKGGYY